MREVVILGVGMHPFGKFLDVPLRDLTAVAVWQAIEDAGVDPRAIDVAYFGNAVGGIMTGQESVRGQVALKHAGLYGIPVVNVDNACASSSTALHEAVLGVGSGMYDVALAVGAEKLYSPDTGKSIEALASATDVEVVAAIGMQFTAYYAMELREFMEKTGTTQEDFARVVVKNSKNGSLNPYAQFRQPRSPEEVLAAREIAYPLTLYMCSAMGDGAAAAIVCAKEVAGRLSSRSPVSIKASTLMSGVLRQSEADPDTVVACARKAYSQAGIGPEDVEVVEVHDAMAPAEIQYYEELGLCGEGEGKELIRRGATDLTGEIPVNPSGGLASRGHPVGATGLAQIAEIVWQLRGEAGERQVKGKNGTTPRVGLTHNAGGLVEGEPAACCIHILSV